MPVYFLADNESLNYDNLRVKIGYSGDIQRRIREHQVGSPHELKLMGYINGDDDRLLEKELHEKYADKRVHGEWFNLSVEMVFDELRLHSTKAFIGVESNSLSIIYIDNDGIPEVAGAWQWLDVDHQEFCPQCGWGGGLSINENFLGAHCLTCDFIG